jgi:hypothetical protein
MFKASSVQDINQPKELRKMLDVAPIEDWANTDILGVVGSAFENVNGKTTNQTRSCDLFGCGGTRIMVTWPDGSVTWPCCNGIVVEKNHLRII